VPVVVVSAQDDRDTVLAALDAGAMGFISKAAPPDELRQAMRDVLVERRIHLPQSVSQDATRQRCPKGRQGRSLSELAALGLTERQIEVLALVVQGCATRRSRAGSTSPR
jgi:DNA-binding NarL/FixJ family response regulator